MTKRKPPEPATVERKCPECGRVCIFALPLRAGSTPCRCGKLTWRVRPSGSGVDKE